jgi:hypothetical protein
MKKEDLKPGMLIHDGLILEVYPNGKADSRFWTNNEPHMLFVSGYDAYHGPCLRSLKEDEEFKEQFLPGSPEYVETVKNIKTFLVEISDRQKDIDKLLQYL